jgi:galactokinase
MIRIKAPGRITLFGEHQDYLNYPVISMAISKYIYLKAERISDKKFIINLADINKTIEIDLRKKEIEYETKRDYLKSGYNQLLRKGFKFEKGYKIKIWGDIPVNAGAASSSALVIAWLYFLYLISNFDVDKSQLAFDGYNAEVKEFGEAGGKMDFFTSVYGGILYLNLNTKTPIIKQFNIDLDGIVLGDSLEKKDTVEDLRRTKLESKEAFRALKNIMPSFDKFSTPLEKIKKYLMIMEKSYQKKIIGNMINRNLTEQAKNLLLKYRTLSQENLISKKDSTYFYNTLGDLITRHHQQLRDNIKISTQKIDKMISSCIKAGAYGAKINGSGFGGTMFVLAPGREDKICKIIKKLGGKPYQVNISPGVGNF